MTTKERLAKLEHDKNERRKIFKELCAHLAEGMSLESFSLLSANSIRAYLKSYPEEFIQEELDDSLRQGRDWWERIGKSQASGQCLGNSRTWFYNMANRYGWREKIEVEAEHKGQVSINVVSYATEKARKASESNE
jgi:hypothetical protein